MSKKTGSVVVLDVPLLVQAGLHNRCDRLIWLECEDSVRHQRLVQRGLSAGQVAAEKKPGLLAFRRALYPIMCFAPWIHQATSHILGKRLRGFGRNYKQFVLTVTLDSRLTSFPPHFLSVIKPHHRCAEMTTDPKDVFVLETSIVAQHIAPRKK